MILLVALIDLMERGMGVGGLVGLLGLLILGVGMLVLYPAELSGTPNSWIRIGSTISRAGGIVLFIGVGIFILAILPGNLVVAAVFWIVVLLSLSFCWFLSAVTRIIGRLLEHTTSNE